jgi:two-component system copper resistance phosphate regulon response regulator CusR
MPRILVIEDEEGLSGAIKEWLEADLYVVKVVQDGCEALSTMLAHNFEVIILDVMLPGMSGIEVCKEYRRAVAEFLSLFSQLKVLWPPKRRDWTVGLMTTLPSPVI